MTDLYYYRRCSSTNEIASALARKGASHGVAVISEVQEAGRGRLGKTWTAPPGKGLYCSLIVRPCLAVQDYPKITLVAGLAVATVLEQVTGVGMLLKWPNDVFAKEKKCCGILTESSSPAGEDERFAIVGIGININSAIDDFPEELQEKITSLFLLTGREHDIYDIFTKVKSACLQRLRQLEGGGFADLLAAWRKRDMLVGKRLQWLSIAGEIVTGISRGPDDDGRLLVKDDEGRIHTVLSGDISLFDI